jgi:hypothetical protein
MIGRSFPINKLCTKLITAIFCTILSTGCGQSKNESKPSSVTLSDLSAQKQLYLKLVKQGKHGWVKSDFNCDSLLYNGLLCASGLDLDITAARGEDGQWYRDLTHTCYERARKHKSDVSKDQLTGLMWCAYVNGYEDLLDELYTWGDEHDWIMGRGSYDVVYFMPQFQNTLRALIGKKQNIPEVAVDPTKDHQRQIETLNWLLRGEKNGHVRSGVRAVVAHFLKSSPANALFNFFHHRFGDGDQTSTLKLLAKFPKDRLPTSADWCLSWLWTRDEKHPGWQPCPKENLTHSGGDFIFIVTLLEWAAKYGH